ncbi:hypothetical protein HDU84_005680, partial [Entophlyctis sp. JEL0112]
VDNVAGLSSKYQLENLYDTPTGQYVLESASKLATIKIIAIWNSTNGPDKSSNGTLLVGPTHSSFLSENGVRILWDINDLKVMLLLV